MEKKHREVEFQNGLTGECIHIQHIQQRFRDRF